MRVEGNHDDALITGLVAAATDHLDGWSGVLGRALVTQTWQQDFAGFGCMRLRLDPVASIAGIDYFDAENQQRELAAETYALRVDQRGAYVDLAVNGIWPQTFMRVDAVSVRYVAGSGVADVPAAIKVAIMLMVATWYNNPEGVSDTAGVELPHAARALIAPYCRISV